jgi:hypothetical protein
LLKVVSAVVGVTTAVLLVLVLAVGSNLLSSVVAPMVVTSTSKEKVNGC